MNPSETVVYETTTDLERYVVVDRTYEGRPARVLFSGDRRAAQSGIGLDDDPDLLFDYNQRILELANGLYPKRILVIGGGAFTLPMALVTALPEARVDVVELDAGLQPIAERYFGLRTNERLTLHFGDGRAFVQAAVQPYDLIVIDVFSELTIPRPFLTVEFIAELHAKLNAGGCVAMNIIASYQGRNAGLIKSQVAAYTQVFNTLRIFPAAYGLTSWLPQNLILVAQKSPIQRIDQYMRFAPIERVEAVSEDMYSDADQTL